MLNDMIDEQGYETINTRIIYVIGQRFYMTEPVLDLLQRRSQVAQ